jgi:inorganic pyrophosphatase
VRTLSRLGPNLLAEIEHFFVSYNEIKGKEFRPLGRHGSRRARELVEEGAARFRRRGRGGGRRAGAKKKGKKGKKG